MTRDNYELPGEDEGDGSTVFKFKGDTAKKAPTSKPKAKYKVTSVSVAFIYISYVVDGVTYGARMKREKAHKNVKAGDEILL